MYSCNISPKQVLIDMISPAMLWLYDLLVPRSRTSTSQQCAFASAGPLLWNCLPVKTRSQVLSTSLSSTPRLLKSFLFPGA